jgi:hypothetical protein
MEPGDFAEGRASSVFVFNPFAEGYIAHGKAFAPVKHQAMLAADLANLPQFLCEPDDVVLVAKRPLAGFLAAIKQAGFSLPEFVELEAGRIDTASSLCQRKLGSLRPWAWGPDSVELLKPLFARVAGESRSASQYFNDAIAQLYSKAWSADFLRKVLARVAESWLCPEQEAGVVVETLEDALGAVAAIRSRGHQRVVVKQACGLAGHNAIRLWESEVSPAQRHWLARALKNGRQLVVEPWLERELDFSVQLEMGPRGLKLCGYTGLINDRKGQFLANRAESDYRRRLPAKVAALLGSKPDILVRLYREIFGMLEKELQCTGFVGPIGIDAFVYRAPEGDCRLKPVVEINPRYTMGRLTVELMRHAGPGTTGLFRLVNQGQTRAAGFANLFDYARSLGERLPLRLEGEATAIDRARWLSAPPRCYTIRQGALCLNDPARAQVCLATFEVGHDECT